MSTTLPPLSLLDLASVAEGQAVGDALRETVTYARKAEDLGYERVWYAEHHNMRSIASSAPAVLIAHVAANTKTIRLGSGGVMLPNHAPLVIAEQFGTLGALHPGRIDLGLGRAPGTDGATLRALRRSHESADTFPQDVQELQGYLTDRTTIPGINAQPGQGIDVPIYILGSSLFGAQLAAALGLPYAFASHFSPTALFDAARVYREGFQPSEQRAAPHFIAAANVLAADTDEEA
ncbi:MAG: LLM class flavin-dependent oxidoreductase, partial [Solirubrobacteraceae bacterium]|nr:LLM class flavin-dependent oxidoreductase [Solirubrobacteraceae bacterium]